MASSKLIPREFINELLARTDIVNLIDSHLPTALVKKGNNYMSVCPFHDEKTPSFSVSAHKQFYYCFGCGAKGNAISFLLEHERLTFPEAVSKLASQAGLTMPQQSQGKPAFDSHRQTDLHHIMDQVNQYYQQQLRRHPHAKQAQNYLLQRGLSINIIKQYQLGYAPPGWNNLLQHPKLKKYKNDLTASGVLVKKENGNVYDRYRNRITFPIHDHRGRIIGFGGRVIDNKESPKYLNSPETALFHKRKELYGLHLALQADRNLNSAILVEGYMDVIMLAQYGINNAIATLGTTTSQEHLKLLSRYCKHIIFCFDGDNAGQKAAWHALENALPILTDDLQIQFMFLPQGEDPDSMIRKIGKDAFTAKINSAPKLPEFMYTQLTRQVNLSTMDGKSKLVKLSTPLLNKISAPTLHHLMTMQLSKLVHIDIENLKHLLKQSGEAIPSQRPQNHKRLPTLYLTIALLLQNPHLAQHAIKNKELIMLDGKGGRILLKLLDILERAPQLTTGALVEVWRDQAEFVRLSQLASWQHHVPLAGIEAEFSGAITRLIELSQAGKINRLIYQADTQGLTAEERQSLQQLIKEKQAIKSHEEVD
ncbi:MAG: DNA primase [Gammaproteobacteria bacterium]